MTTLNSNTGHVKVKSMLPVAGEVLWSYLMEHPEWHPGTKIVEIKGNIKSFTTQEGRFDEEFFVDPDNYSYRYTFITSPLPLIDYQACFKINKLSKEECEVEWSSSFLPDSISRQEAEDLVREVYQDAVKQLHKIALKI